MAIKKRTFTKPEPVTEIAEIPVVINEAVPEGDIAVLDIEQRRVLAYVRGSSGRQPHPKDEDVASLLEGVRYVQNTGKEARIEEFYRSRIRSPLTAIRALMVLANDGPRKASDDTSTDHPLWLFRHGKNPFYGKLRNENEEADDDD